MLIILYARREPTNDSETRKLWPDTKKRDVVFYKDREAIQFYARYPWHYSACPRRGRKTIVLNCFKWAINWIDDLPEPGK